MFFKINPQSNPQADRLLMYCRLIRNNRTAGCDVNLFSMMEAGTGDDPGAEELHVSAAGLHGNSHWPYAGKEGLENHPERKSNGFFNLLQDGTIHYDPSGSGSDGGMRCDEPAEMRDSNFDRHASHEDKRCLKGKPGLPLLLLKTNNAYKINIHPGLPACMIVGDRIDADELKSKRGSAWREMTCVVNTQKRVTVKINNDDKRQHKTVGHFKPVPETALIYDAMF